MARPASRDRKRNQINRRRIASKLLTVETLERRELLATAAGTPFSLGSIHTDGDNGDFGYYASGND